MSKRRTREEIENELLELDAIDSLKGLLSNSLIWDLYRLTDEAQANKTSIEVMDIFFKMFKTYKDIEEAKANNEEFAYFELSYIYEARFIEARKMWELLNTL